MGLRNWSKTEVAYGRSVLHSGLQGARSGREAFLNGRPFASFLGQSMRTAVPPAAVTACIAAISSRRRNNGREVRRALAFGLLGGTVGFGLGLAWTSRRVAASAVQGASRNIRQIRDERWMKKHSIAYA